MRHFLLCFVLLVSFINAAHAKRVALVIGNDAYDHVSKLEKAVNDAKAVAKAARDIGFQVISQVNVDRKGMNHQLDKLADSISAGDEVLFFFAGHGISVKGQNYLLPTDIPKIKPGQERSVTKEAFSEDEIIDILREKGAKVSILIIDACRNNPFPKKGTRSVGRSVGLDYRQNPPDNTFVMYSAGIGQEALDRLSEGDTNPNSVFTRKLLPLLKTPGLSHVKMAKQLQVEVEQLALTSQDRHKQFPAFYDQVRGEYYLVPKTKEHKTAVKTQEAPKVATPLADTKLTAAETLWEKIKNSQNASEFEFYLKEHPDGRHSSLAKLNLQRLKSAQLALVSPPKVRRDGKERRGWLGVNIQNASDNGGKTGVLIVSLAKDGPALPAGLLAGDIITQVGNKKVDTMRDLARLIAAEGEGKNVKIHIVRNQKSRTVNVTLSSLYTRFQGFQKAALSGDAEAMKQVAEAYHYGRGIEKDFNQAINWYQKSGENGHSDAFNKLGFAYKFGTEVTKDLFQAANWFRKGADKGDAVAMNQLGNMYYSGEGLAKDYGLAQEWYQKAADKGQNLAMNSLAYMYQYGQGVGKDYNKSLEWYKKSAANGNASAMNSVGTFYENGYGVDKDYLTAHDWYERSAKKGDEYAMRNLGQLYKFGRGVDKDYTKAVNWFRQSANKGYSSAMFSLGFAYDVGQGVTQDYNQALTWYRKAADIGHTLAMYNIGVLYNNGDGVSKDYTQAANWVAKSLKKKSDYALEQMTKTSDPWNKGFRKELQKILKDEGLYKGAIDGQFGPDTITAIKALSGVKNSNFNKFFDDFFEKTRFGPVNTFGMKLKPRGRAKGLEVVSVSGVAEEKGIKSGDVIVEVSGVAVKSIEDLNEQVKKAKEKGRKAVLFLVERGENVRFVALRMQ